jgi:hypothetical protein
MAAAGEDIEIDQRGTAVFEGTGSTDNVGVTGWTWTFEYNGSLRALEGSTKTFKFDLAGVYEVTLTVVDAEGNEGTDQLTVHVLDVTEPKPVPSVPKEADQHEEVMLDGTGSTDNIGIVNHSWTITFNGTETVLYGRTVVHAFEEVGVHVIELVVNDPAGNRASTSVEITVRDATDPEAMGQATTPVKAGDEVVFDGSASTDNVGIVSWEWSFTHDGTVEMLSGKVATFKFGKAGNYTVRLNVTDAAGNSATTILSVDVRKKEESPGFESPVAWLAMSVLLLVSIHRRRPRSERT